MTTYRPVIWTAELRKAAGDLCTAHRNQDVVSRAREIWNGARVGQTLTPMNVEFVCALRSRFDGMVGGNRSASEAAFEAAWGAAWDAAEAEHAATQPKAVAVPGLERPTEITSYELELRRANLDVVTTITIEEDGEHDGGFDVAELIAEGARAKGYNVRTYHRTTTRGRARLYRA